MLLSPCATLPSRPVITKLFPFPVRSSVVTVTPTSLLEPLLKVSSLSYLTRTFSREESKRWVWPPVVSTTAPAEGPVTAMGGPTGPRRLNCSATNTANTTPKTAMMRRAFFLKTLEAQVLGSLQVGERQLDVCFSIVLVLFQRERDVERGPVLGQVVVPFSGTPGDRTEDAAVLLEGHLEMAFLQLA